MEETGVASLAEDFFVSQRPCFTLNLVKRLLMSRHKKKASMHQRVELP
jgi:hypothetical protein